MNKNKDIMQWLANLQDTSFERYASLFNKYVSSTKGSLLQNYEGSFTVKTKDGPVTVTPPKYVFVASECEKTRRKASDLHKQLVANKSIEVEKELKNTLDYLDSIEYYYSLVNSGQVALNLRSSSEEMSSAISKIEKQLKMYREKLLTPKRSELSIKEYRKKIVAALAQKHELERARDANVSIIDFVITDLPKFATGVKKAKKATVTKTIDNEEEIETKEKVTKAKKTSTKTTTKARQVNTENDNQPLNIIVKTSLLKNFAFKTADECTTKLRSKPYYISKDKLIEAISNDEELLKIFPKNFRKMTKEDLCHVLFAS